MDNRNNNDTPADGRFSPQDQAVQQPDNWKTGVEQPSSADRAPVDNAEEETNTGGAPQEGNNDNK